jgi:hypothetical protein
MAHTGGRHRVEPKRVFIFRRRPGLSGWPRTMRTARPNEIDMVTHRHSCGRAVQLERGPVKGKGRVCFLLKADSIIFTLNLTHVNHSLRLTSPPPPASVAVFNAVARSFNPPFISN